MLSFWGDLSDPQRLQLFDDLDQVDFGRCQPLIPAYVQKSSAGDHPKPESTPPESLPAQPGAEHRELYVRARQLGDEALANGRVAAFMVAGGQGTRLGFDGPKGTFRITPVRNASLFQVFAESLHGDTAASTGARQRWYIMTSPANHADTLAYFDQQGYFGLHREQVFFFQQRQMPAFLPDGRIALAEKHRLALSPDGHGGSLRALAESGALDDMRRNGVDTISYFQVDNPLVRTLDPLFVGLHLATGSEMSSKAVAKAHDTERVGNFCRVDGKVAVIEYSDLPERAGPREESGRLAPLRRREHCDSRTQPRVR